MNKFRAFLWTSILGGSLLVSSGSALANSGHGRQGVSYHKHRPQLIRVFSNHRGKIIKSLRPGHNHFGVKGYYVRRNGHYYWVSGHRRLGTGSAPIAEALGVVDPCGEFRVP